MNSDFILNVLETVKVRVLFANIYHCKKSMSRSYSLFEYLPILRNFLSNLYSMFVLLIYLSKK